MEKEFILDEKEEFDMQKFIAFWNRHEYNKATGLMSLKRNLEQSPIQIPLRKKSKIIRQTPQSISSTKNQEFSPSNDSHNNSTNNTASNSKESASTNRSLDENVHEDD